MTARAIHVQPGPRGHWLVRDEHDPHPSSEHLTANEAERAALSRARASGVTSIAVHDLYQRVRWGSVDHGIRL
jgi:hypothetical protein